jgi:hypothetical protein
LKRSKLQARGKVESVALDAFANVEVMDPARVEIEMTFT